MQKVIAMQISGCLIRYSPSVPTSPQPRRSDQVDPSGETASRNDIFTTSSLPFDTCDQHSSEVGSAFAYLPPMSSETVSRHFVSGHWSS